MASRAVCEDRLLGCLVHLAEPGWGVRPGCARIFFLPLTGLGSSELGPVKEEKPGVAGLA